MRQRRFKLVAGHPVLDFANTLDNRYDPERTIDLLSRYADLLDFVKQADVLPESSLAPLYNLDGHQVSDALGKMRELREIVERIFGARSHRMRISSADLAGLNRFVAEAAPNRELAQDEGMFGWRWVVLKNDADAPLWPIAVGAAELLISGGPSVIRECEEQTCRWLFLDVSRNHSRRWCDMKLCGNRNKARRHYKKLTNHP
jgi:predicted RNA-binding Zn ribbon-like protein